MGTRLDFQFGPGKERRRRAQTDPLRVLVISDLRGNARAAFDAARPLAHARVQGVDIDNFDTLLDALAPALALPAADGGEPLSLSFRKLSDFHPDHLYDQSKLIAALRKTRERLLDPKTFEAEKARLLAETGAPAAQAADASAPPAGASDSSEGGSPLERLLGKRPAGESKAPATAPASAIDQLLRQIVSPHVVHAPGPEQQRLVASVDAAITAELRRILHAPAFQRLEAAWRGLFWLVHNNPVGGEDFKVSVLDASRAEIEADLRACGGDLARSQLYQLVVERDVSGPGGKPIAVVVGDFRIEGSEADVSLLAGLGAVAAQAGGALLSAADPRLVGAHDLLKDPNRGSFGQPDAAAAQRMALLQQSAVAPFIGLVMPRVLGRVPYGKRSDPIERFDFSELQTGPAHEDFLWINPAFACVQLIASAFAEASWNFSLGSELELGDLPLAVYHDGYDQQLKPCAEVALDYNTAEHMLAQGYMALISHRSEASLRLPRFQSIAKPLAPLAGPWK